MLWMRMHREKKINLFRDNYYCVFFVSVSILCTLQWWRRRRRQMMHIKIHVCRMLNQSRNFPQRMRARFATIYRFSESHKVIKTTLPCQMSFATHKNSFSHWWYAARPNKSTIYQVAKQNKAKHWRTEYWIEDERQTAKITYFALPAVSNKRHNKKTILKCKRVCVWCRQVSAACESLSSHWAMNSIDIFWIDSHAANKNHQTKMHGGDRHSAWVRLFF